MTGFQKDIVIALFTGIVSGLVAFGVAAWQIKKENTRSEEQRKQDKKDAELDRKETEKRIYRQMEIQNSNELNMRRQLYYDQKKLEDHLINEKKTNDLLFKVGYLDAMIHTLEIFLEMPEEGSEKLSSENQIKSISFNQLVKEIMLKDENIFVLLNEANLLIDDLRKFISIYYYSNADISNHISELSKKIILLDSFFNDLKVNANKDSITEKIKNYTSKYPLKEPRHLLKIGSFIKKERKNLMNKFNNIDSA